jgi:hypothetical protein
VYSSLLTGIVLRGKCTSWFARQDQCASNEALQHSNTKHGFFNDTLETIRSILKPFVEPPPERPEIVTDNPSTLSAAQNMFDTLSRLELANDEDDEPVIHTAKAPEIVKDLPTDVAFKADKSGDVLMAICCLFQDFLELQLVYSRKRNISGVRYDDCRVAHTGCEQDYSHSCSRLPIAVS